MADDFKDLAKLLTGKLEGSGEPLSDEEFDKLYPDWDEVCEAIAQEGERRKKEKKDG
jgi:hypothetical protein